MAQQTGLPGHPADFQIGILMLNRLSSVVILIAVVIIYYVTRLLSLDPLTAALLPPFKNTLIVLIILCILYLIQHLIS